MAEDNALSASAKGATFLILLQIGSRAVTFALNQVLLRFLSPALLGASVQLELFFISTLYFARESFRVAAQRRSDGGVQAAVNLAYLSYVVGPPVGLILTQLYLHSQLPDVPYLTTALWAYLGAAMVELLSEPAYVAIEQTMQYKVRASAEAAAIVSKTLATASTAIWSGYAGIDVGVLPFAAGELAWALTLTAVYLFRTAPSAKHHHFSLLPVKIRSSDENNYAFSLFYKPLLSLSLSLYVQTGIKYILTQGDTILVTRLASLEDQGVYALSANYGGLIARMLFRPIEDSSRNLFAKLCALPSKEEKASGVEGSKKVSNAGMVQAANVLQDILRIYSLISCVAFAVGPTVAPLLLTVVAGSRWTDAGAGSVLGKYCFYIPLLAFNGVTEAFVAATALTADLQMQSVWMGFFFASFAVSAYLFLQVMDLGAEGLVYANCINMISRIAFNVNFVQTFFKRNGVDTFRIGSLLPNVTVIASIPVVPILFNQLQTAAIVQRYGLFGDLAAIGLLGGTFTVFVLTMHRAFLVDCYRRAVS